MTCNNHNQLEHDIEGKSDQNLTAVFENWNSYKKETEWTIRVAGYANKAKTEHISCISNTMENHGWNGRSSDLVILAKLFKLSTT